MNALPVSDLPSSAYPRVDPPLNEAGDDELSRSISEQDAVTSAHRPCGSLAVQEDLSLSCLLAPLSKNIFFIDREIPSTTSEEAEAHLRSRQIAKDGDSAATSLRLRPHCLNQVTLILWVAMTQVDTSDAHPRFDQLSDQACAGRPERRDDLRMWPLNDFVTLTHPKFDSGLCFCLYERSCLQNYFPC